MGTDINRAADFAIANNGSLAYAVGPALGRERTLAWVDREGREEAIPVEPRGYENFSLSPDGTKLALDVCCDADENGIWIWDFVRNAIARLTFDPQRTLYPVWTPDGRRVVFASTRGGAAMNLFSKSADGTGTIERLTESAKDQSPAAFTPDGRQIVFWEVAETSRDLLVRSLDDAAKVEPLLATESSEAFAQISPDGRWIAYRSDVSGPQEIWVRPFPDVDGGTWQVSSGGGARPRWSTAGRELFYLSPSGQLMSVRYDTDPFTYEPAELVLEESFNTGTRFAAVYDVPPDGQRFVKIKEGASPDDAEPGQVLLVQNWLDELKRLVPVDQ